MSRFTCREVATAAGLGDPQQKGQELLFPCPNHEDAHPSLAINERKNVWMCGPCGASGNAWSLAAFFAGCQADDKEGVIRWLRGHGLFKSEGGGKGGSGGEFVCSYTYTDESGAPLFQIRRYRNSITGKKSFSQHRPGENGDWVPRITDDQGNLLVRLVPYRLPEFQSKPLVIILEGEGDVEEMREWGIPATCNSGGAGNWKPELGFAQFFKGKCVPLIADNDTTGKNHVCEVARDLMHVASGIRIIFLPGLPPKEDFGWWKQAGGTKEQFQEIVKATPDLTLKDLEKLEEEVRKEKEKQKQKTKNKQTTLKPASRPEDQPNLLEFGLHDTGNAERLIALYGQDLRYSYDFKKWLVWDGRRWAINKVGRANKLAKETMVKLYAQALNSKSEKLEKFAKSCLNKMRIKSLLELAECELPIEFEKLDTHPYLLNCLNGTLDLRTGDLLEHRREDLITKLCHYDYNPDAECPLFLKFLNEIMGVVPEASESDLERADQLVKYLQKTFGYALTGDVSEKAVFCFFGGGNNGKSTLLEAVSSIIAEYSSQVLIDSLMSSKGFGETNNSSADLADLRGARLVTTSEGEEGQRLAESKVKYLSAGMGKIKTARKYENHIQFEATHKLFMDSNYKPVVRGVDNAIWNRLKAVPFTTTIPKDQIDEELPNKLKAEGEGILAWAVKGVLRWQKEGLDEPPEVAETGKGWREDMDPLKDFLEDLCWLGGEEMFCPSAKLWKAYTKWAENNGERPFGRRKFNDRLRALGCEPCVRGAGSPKCWSGIGLKSQDEEPEQAEF